MAKVIAGEAAVRIVPTLKRFHNRVDTELKRKPHSVTVNVDPAFKSADAQMAAWRKRQEANALNIPVRAKTDFAGFTRDLRQVEHLFKRSSLSQAVRLNVAVVGLDALPALAYAAGSAASALDALGKSAFALPGLLGGALASVGALATGLSGVGDALKAYGKDAADSADRAKKARDADRDLLRAKRDLKNAIRDQRREIEDLNAEMRRSSLNEADAILNIQEAVDRLREGGFKSVTEFQRAQLNVLRSVDDLNNVRRQTARTAEDTAKANAEGIEQSDRVVDALDRVADATEALKESSSGASALSDALAKLSPNARKTVEAIRGLQGAWTQLQQSVQNDLFQDIDRVITDLGQRGIPVLESGLSRVAQGLNENFKQIASSLGSDKNLGLFDRIFGNTKGGLENLSRGMDPLISAFTRLTEVSSRFLPRLGDAFTTVATRFENFINSAAEDGRLERWIDQGLDALTSLGNAAINVGSIVSSIGEAFNAATGTAGGLIGSLERGTKTLADWLRSPEGQRTLINYFQRARDFVVRIIDALKRAKGFLSDVVSTAREWSAGFFEVVGALASVASWVERNTGLLKPLLIAYLSIKSAKPIIEGLTGAWKNYNRTITALANYDLTAKYFAPAAQGAQQFKSQLSAVGGVASGASSKIKLSTDAVRAASNHSFAALKPINNLSAQFGGLGDTAKTAAGKVGGGAGAAASSLGGSLIGLARFAIPGLVATGAVVGLTTLITKLGEAHDKAAEQARTQAAALDQLKGSLDRVTGSATTQTIGETAKSFEKFTIPGIGEVNVNELARQVGLNPTDVVRAASDPTAQGLRNDLQGRLDTVMRERIESDPEYQKRKAIFDDAGITSEDIAKAVRGDPAALAEYRTLMQKADAAIQLGDFSAFGTGRIADLERFLTPENARIPTLTDFMERIGAPAQVGFGLGTTAQALGDESRAIANATEVAQGGKFGLSPQGQSRFGQFEPDPNVRIDPVSQRPVVRLNSPPPQDTLDRWSESGVQILQNLPGGGVEIALPADSPEIQKLKGGGLVQGEGTGTSDSNLAMLSKGEWVTRKKAVDHYGQTFFDDLNNMRLPRFETGGGWFGPKKPIVPPPPPAPKPAPVLTPQAASSYRPPPPPPARPPAGPLTAITGVGQSMVQKGPLPALAGRSIAPSGSITREGFDKLKTDITPIGYAALDAGASVNLGVRADDSLPQPGFSRSLLAAQGLPTAPKIITPPKAPPPKPQPKPAPKTPQKPYVHNPKPSRQKDGTYYSPTTGHTSDPGGKIPVSGSAPSGSPAPTVTHGTGGQPGPHHGGATPGVPTPAGPGTPIIPITSSVGVPATVLSNAGVPLPSRLGGEDGLQVNTIAVKRAVEAAFPQITSIGGVRADALKWHPNGLAIDVMIPGAGGLNDPTPAEGKALGDQIYAYLMSNKEALGIDHILWQEKDHFNHLHVATTGGGYPTGSEQYTLPGGTQVSLPGVLQAAGLPANLLPGQGVQPGQPFDLGQAIAQRFQDAYKPENIQQYFEGLAQNIGSSLSSIGLNFLGGITGLDFGSVLGPLQEVGNHFLGDSGGGSGGSSDATSLNAEADANMQAYIDGQLPTSLSPDVLSALNIDPTQLGLNVSGSGSSGGAERWRPLVRKILQQVAPRYGITNIKAWEDAIVKQIDTESGGNPGAANPNDSNGQGGTQSVNGLLQFLPSTFAAHNVIGGDYMDPVAQIYAAIDYVASKYGMDASGAPKQIGRGVGFKAGGLIRGAGGRDQILARVSRGEFLTNPKAVRHYGASTFAALNNMQIPREQLPGFFNGGWWNPLLNQPQPAPPPPPVPPGQPAPPSAPAPPPPPGGQSAGPLPLSVSGVGQSLGAPSSSAPSTGGAPGPGATAPAPAPSPLPQVSDALAGIGGATAAAEPGQGAAQPGADPSNPGDNRGTLGQAPASGQHLNPAISQGIQGIASTIGNAASTAASAAGMVFGGPAGAQAGGAAGSMISSAAQIGGQVITGAANILASLAVGTLSGGSTAQASGVPLLPQRAPMQTGVPQTVINDQRQYQITNLDEYKRLQERSNAQQMMPYISKF